MLLPVLIAMVAGWLQRHQQQVITYLLDYKPEARKEKHAITQLTIYALALSRRTGLSVRAFKCAWFDERDYFEFFLLPAIYPRYGHDSQETWPLRDNTRRISTTEACDCRVNTARVDNRSR